MENEKVSAQCGPCAGTGIIDASNQKVCSINKGHAESQGTGIVCVNCKGSGEVSIEYTPFTSRKEKKGIEQVVWWSGFGRDKTRHTVEYSEFVQEKRPSKYLYS